MTESEAIERLKLSCDSCGSDNCRLCDEALEIAIKALEELQELKEKSVAKKQGNINDYESHLRLNNAGFLCCSRTNKDIRYPLISLGDLEYCPRCGQKIDWEWKENRNDRA